MDIRHVVGEGIGRVLDGLGAVERRIRRRHQVRRGAHLRPARGDADALAALDSEVRHTESELLHQVARLLDDEQTPMAAAERVRALMFIQKFRRDLSQRLEAMSD